MKAWLIMPGVPMAGHVTSGGAWHPGAIGTCNRCTPPEVQPLPNPKAS